MCWNGLQLQWIRSIQFHFSSVALYSSQKEKCHWAGQQFYGQLYVSQSPRQLCFTEPRVTMVHKALGSSVFRRGQGNWVFHRAQCNFRFYRARATLCFTELWVTFMFHRDNWYVSQGLEQQCFLEPRAAMFHRAQVNSCFTEPEQLCVSQSPGQLCVSLRQSNCVYHSAQVNSYVSLSAGQLCVSLSPGQPCVSQNCG